MNTSLWPKRPRMWAAVAGIAWLMAGPALHGQTNPATATTTRNGTVLVPERPTAVDANVSGSATVTPARPDQAVLPTQVRSRLDRFKISAKTYLAQQEALKKKMVGANEQERNALREQLRVLREKWLEQAREMRLEQQDQKQELQKKLQGHKELFDEMRENANEQLRNSGDHTRRGLD